MVLYLMVGEALFTGGEGEGSQPVDFGRLVGPTGDPAYVMGLFHSERCRFVDSGLPSERVHLTLHLFT